MNLLRVSSNEQNNSSEGSGQPSRKKGFKQKSNAPQSTPRRRRFPYRKTEELEHEILQREARLEQLHESLTVPDLLRDGDRVKAAKHEIEQQKAELETLYQHWEEAVELN